MEEIYQPYYHLPGSRFDAADGSRHLNEKHLRVLGGPATPPARNSSRDGGSGGPVVAASAGDGAAAAGDGDGGDAGGGAGPPKGRSGQTSLTPIQNVQQIDT